jgi:hypothetical protein
MKKKRNRHQFRAVPKKKTTHVPRRAVDPATQVPYIADKEGSPRLEYVIAPGPRDSTQIPNITINLPQQSPLPASPLERHWTILLVDKIKESLDLYFIYLIVLVVIFVWLDKLKFDWHLAVEFVVLYLGGLALLKLAGWMFKPKYK